MLRSQASIITSGGGEGVEDAVVLGQLD